MVIWETGPDEWETCSAYVYGGGLRSDKRQEDIHELLHPKLGRHGKGMQTTYDSLNRKGCLAAH
jgi:hypothetical protein